MPKPKSHKRRDANFVLLGVVFICIIIAVAVISTWIFINHRNPIDRVTLCPEKGAEGHVVLLVDTTDPLNYTQTAAFRQFISEFGNDIVKKGELCSIFALGEDFRATSKPVFEMCSPGNGEGESFIISNPAKQRKWFKEKFIEPMEKVTKSLFTEKPSKHSPLMEMFQMVSINGFRKAGVDGPKKLIIVSDMLHNTENYSLYRDSMDFDEFSKTSYFKRVQTDLDQAEVELRYLMHTPRLQTRTNALFWEKYFSNMNGVLVSTTPWEG